MWSEIAQAISQETGQEFAIASIKSVSGGCINQGYQVSSQTMGLKRKCLLRKL
jgi:fructosamine-3-kinase